MAEVSAAFLRAKALQELMVRKVGGDHSVEAEEYEQVRRAFLRDPQMPPHLIPELVKDNRDLDTLWTYAKDYHGSWEPRRRHVREEFGPLLDHLDRPQLAPADGAITSGLTRFDSEAVTEAWQRALQRRSSDPAVNRRLKGTPYRRAIGTPSEVGHGRHERTACEGWGVGRA